MHYPICWDQNRVRAVLTTESRQKTRDLFLQTHRPFQRIRVDFCKDIPLTNPFISEQRLREIVTHRPLDADNRLFFVVGEAGSGKSELSQWLEYTVDDPTCLPIHIPRSLTTALQVTRLIRKRLHPHGSAPVSQTPPQRQLEYISLTAVMMLYDREFPALTPPVQWESLLLSAGLQQHVATYLATTPSNREPAMLLTHSMLHHLCAEHMIPLPEQQIDAISTALHHLLLHAIDHTWGVADVRQLLTQLSQSAIATGRRPLLLIEDITAFQSFSDILLDYLLDLTSGHFDALIGVTTGFERTQLAKATFDGDLTHIHHRLRGRFVLTDEQGHSYGFEEDLIAFTRSYLAAIRPDCATCALRPACASAFGSDLYPFTELMLVRALHNIHEEGNPRQTPRLFLEHVLGAVLLASEIPAVVLDHSPIVQQPPALFRSDEHLDAALESTLRWYGDIDAHTVQLDRRIADHWHLPAPEAAVSGDQLVFPRIYVVALDVPNVDTAHWLQEVQEFQQWLLAGVFYPSRETLKRGIERVLLALGDPRSLGNPSALSLAKSEIVYARGDERLPLMLGGNSGDIEHESRVAIQIRPQVEDRAILEELVYVSLSNDSFAHVCQNLAQTLAWAQHHWDIYHSQIQQHLSERLGGMHADVLILATWQLVCGLVGQAWTSPPSLTPLMEETSYAEVTCWSPEQRGCYNAGAALFVWHEQARRLFIGVFGLRETLLDVDRYTQALATIQATDAVHLLAVLDLARVRTLAFKIRPDNVPLHQLLTVLQRYAAALIHLDLEHCIAVEHATMSEQQQHLKLQSGTDGTALRPLIDHLRRRCSEVGLAWQLEWDTALALLQTLEPDTLDMLATDISQALTELKWPAGLDIHAYQEWLHRWRPLRTHPYWQAVSNLQHVQTALLQAARGRYRRTGRLLSGTTAYHDLRQRMQALKKELTDDGTFTH